MGAAVQRTSAPIRPSLHVVSLDKGEQSASDRSMDSAKRLVKDLLDGLHHNTELELKKLLFSSTNNWRSKIYDAVGAPTSANEDKVARALADAMRHPENQFAILLGLAEDFYTEFPSDTVSYNDGEAWVECRLYNKKDGELLVVTGWQLHENPVNGDWLIDSIDWQDFRDQFYPGLGREEWARAFV